MLFLKTLVGREEIFLIMIDLVVINWCTRWWWNIRSVVGMGIPISIFRYPFAGCYDDEWIPMPIFQRCFHSVSLYLYRISCWGNSGSGYFSSVLSNSFSQRV